MTNTEITQIRLRLLELSIEIFKTTPHEFNSVLDVYLDLKKEFSL